MVVQLLIVGTILSLEIKFNIRLKHFRQPPLSILICGPLIHSCISMRPLHVWMPLKRLFRRFGCAGDSAEDPSEPAGAKGCWFGVGMLSFFAAVSYLGCMLLPLAGGVVNLLSQGQIYIVRPSSCTHWAGVRFVSH